MNKLTKSRFFKWSIIAFGLAICLVSISRFHIFGFYAVIAIIPIILIVYFTYAVYLKNIQASKLQAAQAERHIDALRESEQRFRSAFDHAAGMGLVAPDGRWVQVNKSLCDMLGFSEAELLLGTFQRITHPDDLNVILEQLNQLRAGTISSLQLEQRYFHKTGQVRWVLLSVATIKDTQSPSANLIFQMQDISDRKQAEKKLVHDAFHDALTGLPNRMFFMDQLKQSVQRVKRTQQRPFAVLFLDFDKFKIINDSLGHMVGDRLLIAIANRLRAGVRPGDTVARLGGDEFTILLDSLKNPDDAIDMARRLLSNLSEPFKVPGREVFITVSIGVALSTNGYEHAERPARCGHRNVPGKESRQGPLRDLRQGNARQGHRFDAD